MSVVFKLTLLFVQGNPASGAAKQSNPALASEIEACLLAVREKMSGARQVLESSGHAAVEKNIQYVALIKDCADCINSLQKIVP